MCFGGAKYDFLTNPVISSSLLATLNSSLRARCERHQSKVEKKKIIKEGTRKEEVIKSGAVARFPLRGEVWPEGQPPSLQRPGPSLARIQAARRQARGSQRWERPLAGSHNGVISGQASPQKLSMLPVLRAAAQIVRLPTAR